MKIVNIVGSRGTGKTALAAYMVRKALEEGRTVWCSFPMEGTKSYHCLEDISALSSRSMVVVDPVEEYFSWYSIKGRSTSLQWLKSNRERDYEVVLVGTVGDPEVGLDEYFLPSYSSGKVTCGDIEFDIKDYAGMWSSDPRLPSFRKRKSFLSKPINFILRR